MAAKRNPNAPEDAVALTFGDIRPCQVIVTHYREPRLQHQERYVVVAPPLKSTDGFRLDVHSATNRDQRLLMSDLGICARTDGTWSMSYTVLAN